MLHYLKAKPETVHWGYFDSNITPRLHIKSGDFVHIETVSQHAGDAPDLMMDEGISKIYDEVPVEDRNPGVHILTGPIYVEDAQPGDVLEVSYVQLKPRMLYGSNVSANWGYLYNEFDKKEKVTIYSFDMDLGYVYPEFAYDYPGLYDTPGMIIDPGSVKREKVLEGFKIPIRPHVGTAGVALVESGRVSTIPPGIHGGNIDNWKMAEGSKMYYPVGVEGALFSMGDAHISQGDGEISGTAIECSMDVVVQINVRKDLKISSPILETKDAWIVHGFDHDLNQAMRNTSLEMVHFLTEIKGLTREEAYSLMSVAVDFSITQVVDERQGVHASIRKAVFPSKREDKFISTHATSKENSF